jgi:hypothetical protein
VKALRWIAPLAWLLWTTLPATGRESASDEAARALARVNRQRLRASWQLTVAMRHRDATGSRDLQLQVDWAAWAREGRTGMRAGLLAPAPLRGVALLSREGGDGPDRIWVRLPGGKPWTTEVPAARWNEGVLGFDFSHHDNQRLYDPGDYELTLLGRRDFLGSPCLVVEGRLRAAARAALGYEREIWWIDQRRHEIARRELYRPGNRLAKTIEVERWRQIGSLSLPGQQRARHLEKGSETVLTLLTARKVPTPSRAEFVPEALARFTASLRRPAS